MISFISGVGATKAARVLSGSIQTMDLPQPATNIDPTPARGGGGVTIVDSSALLPQEGPSGTIADIDKPKNDTISRYIVKPGDTVSSIAALFNVSQGTILSANDLKKGQALKPDQELIILPVTGIKYNVKTGDTIASIAKRFGGDPSEIASYNSVDDATLAVGDQIIIPNGEVPALATPAVSVKVTGKASGHVIPLANNPDEPSHNVGAPGSTSQISYYKSPLAHYVQTQGIHGYNAVDLGAPEGTPIVAAAGGDVTVARQGGWNGGYGSYVVISHDNGAQTLYAHMSKVSAYDGEHVVQGQVIGYVGETGLATGPHLHFEIRGGIRNPF
jgi:murein DD-endopeptidase MepM/ murein hydrolase activator NlpD